ncbi:hypothetical protein PRK78_000723 [Emydomyces testavorans]|uniref:Uncharacterized protein n=1 Tax=Emydomyces testavorans TaxID=2070801 RepID=A0AAF0DBZ3_9EURO|nr:hypothetical protein PRK78_000723 [Emydomyces testavorans]
MSRLRRFKDSMESVYGEFSEISDASTWVPPPKSGGHRGRYLWTDAFGVLNFLTLHKENQSPDGKYLTLAKQLASNVHDVLGWTRDGRSRLPGATEKEPLAGGLRIGKESETGPDGDGQYHHYLTLWMFALNRLSMATGDPSYNRQAVSLAKAIHPRFFIDRTSVRPRMVWKVAMDLSRPLVASEGNLDPIDGFVVFRLLQSSAVKYGDGQVLKEEIGDYQRVMARKGKHYVSSDTLDLGMTLWTAHWLAVKEPWATDLKKRCISQLRCIFEPEDETDDAVDLKPHSEQILSQWEQYISSALTPEDLKPITRVMYCTALIPGGEWHYPSLEIPKFVAPLWKACSRCNLAFKAGYFGAEPIREALEE